jgi:hypothetical protein
MTQSTRSTPRLSPLYGKLILLGFDGADMSSDAGLTLLREIERKAGLAQRLADCLSDPAKVQHVLDDIIRFRIMMIAAGYEDGNDADDLRYDPGFKLALERGPETGAALCSQPTISRTENLADPHALIRMGRESAAHIRRLIRQISRYWLKTEIQRRADGHYATPQVPDLCDDLGLSYVFGLPKNSRLAGHVQPLEASTAARYARKSGQKLRRFKRPLHN